MFWLQLPNVFSQSKYAYLRFNRKGKSNFSLGLKLEFTFHSFKRVELWPCISAEMIQLWDWLRDSLHLALWPVLDLFYEAFTEENVISASAKSRRLLKRQGKQSSLYSFTYMNIHQHTSLFECLLPFPVKGNSTGEFLLWCPWCFSNHNPSTSIRALRCFLGF